MLKFHAAISLVPLFYSWFRMQSWIPSDLCDLGTFEVALGFRCCAFVMRSGLSLLERSHPEVTCVLFSIVTGDDIPSHHSLTSFLPGLPIGKLFPLLNLQALAWEVLCNHYLAPFKLLIRFWFQNKLTGAHLVQWMVICLY